MEWRWGADNTGYFLGGKIVGEAELEHQAISWFKALDHRGECRQLLGRLELGFQVHGRGKCCESLVAVQATQVAEGLPLMIFDVRDSALTAERFAVLIVTEPAGNDGQPRAELRRAVGAKGAQPAAVVLLQMLEDVGVPIHHPVVPAAERPGDVQHEARMARDQLLPCLVASRGIGSAQ